MADPNTRQGKRTPVTLKIKFKSETLEQFIERYAVDVSQGGIFIRTKEPLAVGTQMRFEFQLRDASPLIGGEGTVVWTRENDPSRPAIAPGMGVRFDRLAEGSQTVLERILAEKAKQAPQRPLETTKPPMFTDTPTRVAPPPVQEQLLGNDSRRNKRGSNEGFSDQSTPLPKPMPFHSDADEFPEEAFEEATKVRALDDLIAQTSAPEGTDAPIGTSTEPDLFGNRGGAGGLAGIGGLSGLDELAARRGRADSTLAEPPAPNAPIGVARSQPPAPIPPTPVPATLDPSSTSPGFASGRSSEKSLPNLDRDSAPGLPSPPIVEPSKPADRPRLLDTTPSPRTEPANLAATEAAMEKMGKTKLGMEPVLVPTRPPGLSGSAPGASLGSLAGSSSGIKDAPTKPSGMLAVPLSSEPTSSVRMPRKSSALPIVILLLVLVAASGAAVWFFVLREKAQPTVADRGSGSGDKTGSNPAAGSNKEGSDGSAGKVVVDDGSGKGSDEVKDPPKGPPVDVEITSPIAKATVEIVGTEHKGPAPLKAKLEKDKVYKVRISAPGFATLEKDVTAGAKLDPITLDPKPRALDIKSEPAGALIIVDGKVIGGTKLTPQMIDLDAAQAAKKAIKVGFRLNGFRPVERMVDASAFTENADRLVATVTVRLERIPVVIRPPVGPGSAGSGSGTTPGSGSDPNPDGSGAGSAPPPPPPPPTGSGGGGGSAEPTPDFIKEKQP